MGGIFRTTREFVVDRGQNVVDISQDFIVPKAKYAIATRGEILAPGSVHISIVRQHMLAAIDFNNDPSLVARKIRKERPRRRLPSEMCSGK